MLNAGYKKETIANLKDITNKYQKVYSTTMNDIVYLHDKRIDVVEIIKQIEEFINFLVNTPKEFQKILSDIKVNRHKFETEVYNLELQSKNVNKVSGSVAGAGMAAGGGGIAGGEAFLALSGPVGWPIGGAALLGGGLLANSKNKKIAKKAEAQTKSVKIETNNLLKIQTKVKSISDQTVEMSQKLILLLKQIIRYGINDYYEFSDEQLEQLKTLLNVTRSLSSKLCEKVN